MQFRLLCSEKIIARILFTFILMFHIRCIATLGNPTYFQLELDRYDFFRPISIFWNFLGRY